jgi:hypothetical protein
MSGGAPAVSGKSQDGIIGGVFAAIRHATPVSAMGVGRSYDPPTS